MSTVSLGDMAQSFLLRNQNLTLKAHVQHLTTEMSTGVKTDLAAAIGGDFKSLAGIAHSLTALGAYKTATTEAQLLTGSLQTAFETTQTLATDLAPSLSAAGTAGGTGSIASISQDARQKLFSAVSALNVRVGDRYLLSGSATDKKPISGAQDILDGLSAAISGQTTASGAIAAINAWFDAPAGGGGYVDTVYGGAQTPLAPMAIGANDQASMTTTATDDTLRTTLKGLAMGAMVAEGALPADSSGQTLMMKTAGDLLMTSNSSLADLRARLGTVEGQISSVTTRNAAEATSLGMARNNIIAADPYETASQLQTAQTQLETLYALTARLANLNLADYLK